MAEDGRAAGVPAIDGGHHPAVGGPGQVLVLLLDRLGRRGQVKAFGITYMRAGA
jgi:hypothetical protein